MEPGSRTAATGGFTLELEPEGSRQPDFPALERFRELYASKQRRDRKQWDTLVHLAGVPGGLIVTRRLPLPCTKLWRS